MVRSPFVAGVLGGANHIHRRPTAGRDNRHVVPRIYVTGHRNPDTDSIASAIGYAELKGRLDPHNDYVPVRLGDCNTQTRWVLERSGATEPRYLPHVSLRARDVMQTSFPVSGQDQPIREAGLALVRADLELVPIVDDDGALVGVVTERALARRFVRESRETSTLKDAPTTVAAVADALEARVLVNGDAKLGGRVWVQSMDVRPPAGSERGMRWWSGTAPTHSGWRSNMGPRCSCSPTTRHPPTRSWRWPASTGRP